MHKKGGNKNKLLLDTSTRKTLQIKREKSHIHYFNMIMPQKKTKLKVKKYKTNNIFFKFLNYKKSTIKNQRVSFDNCDQN